MAGRRRKRKKNPRFHWHGSRWSPYGAADMSWSAPSRIREVLLSELPAGGRIMVRTQENRAAIYALINPMTGEIRYIGKTTQRSDIRLAQHLESPTNANMRKWIENLRAVGTTPKIRLITCCPVAEWQHHESRWIRWARELGARLLNVDPGGQVRKPGSRKLTTYGRTKRFIKGRDGVGFTMGAARDVWRSQKKPGGG